MRWACDMGDLERNVLGVVIRQEIETRLVPGVARRGRSSPGG